VIIEQQINFFQKKIIKKFMELLEKIRLIATERNITLSQLVINWTINQPGITIALVGIRTQEQAEENAKAVKFQFDT